MEIVEAIRTRRSIKNFSSTPLTREILLALVDTARYSPSGANKNPWRFVIITERKKLEQLSQTAPFCRWLASAQAGVALVVEPSSTRYWLEDCSVAAYALWLAATAQGLGVAWGALYQSDNPTESERRQHLVRTVLSVPERFLIPMVLGIGYPNVSPPERKLPNLETIIYWEQYTEGQAPQN